MITSSQMTKAPYLRASAVDGVSETPADGTTDAEIAGDRLDQDAGDLLRGWSKASSSASMSL